MSAARNSWFVARTTGSERVRLICFPYAGGGAQAYRGWQEALPAAIGVYTAQLPGRGPRLSEPPIGDMNTLLDAFEPWLLPLLDRPFALFGHSMGAVIACETVRRLVRRGLHPLGLFVSARAAPGTQTRSTHDLSEPEFLARLRLIGGTPDEVLLHPELMAMFLPMLRADFRLNDTHVPSAVAPFACPLTVFGGRDDPLVRIEDLEAWRKLAAGGFALKLFDGGHYYFRDAQSELLGEIVRSLHAAMGA
jgi:medium-chain acyl-[acyl-carrier-protein] hydrolase